MNQDRSNKLYYLRALIHIQLQKTLAKCSLHVLNSDTHLLDVIVSAQLLETRCYVKDLPAQTTTIAAHTPLYPDVSLPSGEGKSEFGVINVLCG